MSYDPDAIEIGKLYRKSQAGLGGPVTGARYFPERVLQSRNAGDHLRLTPDACHWCRAAFGAGQMRYPMLTGVNFRDGWGIASVCMDCFKQADVQNATSLHRAKRQCLGCGEPMLTPVNARAGAWHVCSNRCYQRDYRKRRRGHPSTVPWKAHPPSCQACRKTIEGKRRDARFCSPACRQWTYRRRHSEATP